MPAAGGGPSAGGESPPMSEVIVLHALLDGSFDADRAAFLLARLPYARRLELERRDAAARAASLRALELLMDGIGRLRGAVPDPSRLRYAEGAKPAMQGGPWFSVSHSASHVAVAISDACELGIDVEDLAPGADERQLARWTAVEATLKAAGSGLRRAMDVTVAPDLASARLDHREFLLQRAALAPGCVAHVATERAVRLLVQP
jgi:phosphopantetheinyl transferase